MRHHAHLIEERLFDCYLAEHGGETLDPRLAEHLVDCESCAARYAELTAFMDGLQAEGVAEADAAFTPERLRAQQQQIAKRLELAGHPARVLSFPRQVVRGTMVPTSSHAAPRWVAAAAAAGLFVGIAVGATYNYSERHSLTQQMVARQGRTGLNNAASQRPVNPNVTGSAPTTVATDGVSAPVATGGNSPATVASDDAFLSDLEVALERPHTRELQAFDALTPHVREIGLRR